jgi:hypothetical protein
VSETAGLLGPRLDLEGAVSSRETSEQDGEHVLQFVVTTADAESVAVELRGEKLYGVVADGHRVALVLPKDFGRQEDRTLRPLRLKNLTTGGVVSAYSAGLGKRALRAGLSTAKEGWMTLVGLVVTAIVTAVLVSIGVQTQGVGVEGGSDSGPERTVATLLVIQAISLAISGGVAYIAYRRWRWEGGSFPVWWVVRDVVIGLIIGFGVWYLFTG